MKPSPHIRSPYTGPLIDYNGTGIWSLESIRDRYEAAAKTYHSEPAPLAPFTWTESGRTWIYPLMKQIIPLIEAGDPAAADIGIDLLEEDSSFAFGRILKYNTARALRRTSLTTDQQQRIRQRVIAMLLASNVPREFVEYRKLLAVVGPGDLWPGLAAKIDRQNPYVLRHFQLLEQALHAKEPSPHSPHYASCDETQHG